jgi:adenylosuccinate synthase
VAVKYSIMIGGIDSLSLMLLDVLSGLETIKIAVQYKIDGKVVDFFPSDSGILGKVEAIYEELRGWSEDITTATKQEDLPKNAINYLRRLQTVLGCPIKIVSVGPERDQTLSLNL